ncbi:MAG: FAD-dependent oxidoreductase [Elusimicrobia bacterium]|nr:FAD-dependent oxidoreductase [Elusimicrobiota bacterium]
MPEEPIVAAPLHRAPGAGLRSEIVAASQTNELPKTGLWRYGEPFYQDYTPPCNNACLSGQDIVTQLRLVEEKRYKEALDRMMEANPFPAIVGRVCPHPCEQPCNRKALGGAVSIRQIERFLGDWAIANNYKSAAPAATEPPVAIIGAGPGGLAAAFYLRRLGHAVTVFEKQPKIGGLLRYGIPEYRLPRSVIDDELKRLGQMGIKFETGITFGKEVTLNDLKAKGFKAVIFAIGLGKSRRLGAEGENIPEVIDGVVWLREFHEGKPSTVKGRVAVIGGGNTAMDCVRCTMRTGCTSKIIYRRTKFQMPASPEEIKEAEEEGIEFQYLAAPTKVEKNSNGSLKVTVIQMKLGEPDSSGRPRPVPVPGSEQAVEVDYVFKALGEVIARGALPAEILNKDGWPVLEINGKTSLPGVYVCGDAADAGGTVAQAIKSARHTAYAVSSELTSTKREAQNLTQSRGAKAEVAKYKSLKPKLFEKLPRKMHGHETPDERKKDFREIQHALSEGDCVFEATRCFKCGTCNLCGRCETYCPDRAIIFNKEKSRYDINMDYCKGCGVCAEECPRFAVHMTAEASGHNSVPEAVRSGKEGIKEGAGAKN